MPSVNDVAELRARYDAAVRAHFVAVGDAERLGREVLELGRRLAETDPEFCPFCGRGAFSCITFDGPDAFNEARTCVADHSWHRTRPKGGEEGPSR